MILSLFSFKAATASIIIAKIEKANPVGSFSTGAGSRVNLQSDNINISGGALFLGATVSPGGDETYQMYLHLASSKVLLIESNQIENKIQSLQKILDPFAQAGGTCSGYAMDDFLLQTHYSGFTGTGQLASDISSEDGRTSLLVELINQYYLMLNHRFSIKGILNGFGKKYGFKCSTFNGESYEAAKIKILAQLKLGLPVVFSYTIGPNMVASPFKIEMPMHKNPEVDDRLWIPRKIGERNSGGHSIVAAASFELNKKTYLIMIDSDWSEPRVWDMDSFLNSKTAGAEVEFTACK